MSVTENLVDAEQYKIANEPYYEPVGDEIAMSASHEQNWCAGWVPPQR